MRHSCLCSQHSTRVYHHYSKSSRIMATSGASRVGSTQCDHRALSARAEEALFAVLESTADRAATVCQPVIYDLL